MPCSRATQGLRRVSAAFSSTSSSTSPTQASSVWQAHLPPLTTWSLCAAPRSFTSGSWSGTETIPSRSSPGRTLRSSRRPRSQPKRSRTAASVSRRWRSPRATSALTAAPRTAPTFSIVAPSLRAPTTCRRPRPSSRPTAGWSIRSRRPSASVSPRRMARPTGPGRRPRGPRPWTFYGGCCPPGL